MGGGGGSPRAEDDGSGRKPRSTPAVAAGLAGWRRSGSVLQQAAAARGCRAGHGRRLRARSLYRGAGGGGVGAHAKVSVDGTESWRSTPWPDGLSPGRAIGLGAGWAARSGQDVGRAWWSTTCGGIEGEQADFHIWVWPN
jgi:hypothetical protein